VHIVEGLKGVEVVGVVECLGGAEVLEGIEVVLIVQ